MSVDVDDDVDNDDVDDEDAVRLHLFIYRMMKG